MKLLLGMGLLVLSAISANAADRLPRCLGSQSTNCDSSPPQNQGPLVRCTYYKASILCGDFESDGTGCQYDTGEMLCPSPTKAAVTTVAPSITAEGEGSATINFESSEVDACIGGSSLEASQAENMAHSSAMAGCTAHRVDSSKTATSFMIRPTGRGLAECTAHVSVTCLK